MSHSIKQMKRNFKKVEDFKNLPVAKATNEFSVDFEILDFSEIESIIGGKHKDKDKHIEHGCQGLFCRCS